MEAIEKRARELLASCLDEWGHPCEAENVREGEDLDSYESELRLISQLLCFGMDTAESHARAALTPPEGYVLVPLEPTEEMLKVGYSWMMGRIVMRSLYDELLAARPEAQ